MLETIRVRKYVNKVTGRACYKYQLHSVDLLHSDMEELDQIKFIFGRSITEEDKRNVLDKWAHKIMIT